MAIDRKPQPVQNILKLRHWRQRFNPGARFVWRKRTSWRDPEREGKSIVFPVGSILPDWVIAEVKPVKLRRWWESRWIELAEVDLKAAKAPKGKKASGKKKAPKAKAPETPNAAAKREARNVRRREARAAKRTAGQAAGATSSESSADSGISSEGGEAKDGTG